MKKNKYIKKTLSCYYEATNLVTNEFINKYFDEYDKLDSYWIGDEVGYGIFHVSDCFFDIAQMIQALEIKPTHKRLMDAYYYQVENEKPLINFENYLKYGELAK